MLMLCSTLCYTVFSAHEARRRGLVKGSPAVFCILWLWIYVSGYMSLAMLIRLNIIL